MHRQYFKYMKRVHFLLESNQATSLGERLEVGRIVERFLLNCSFGNMG